LGHAICHCGPRASHARHCIHLDVAIIAFLTPIIEAATLWHTVEKTKECRKLMRNFHTVEMTAFCQKDRRHSLGKSARNADFPKKFAVFPSGTLFVFLIFSD
jgi:hypothetical protein